MFNFFLPGTFCQVNSVQILTEVFCPVNSVQIFT